MMLATALRNFGADVTAVDCVAAALDALREDTPHVVVSDIAMPGEDGCSFMMRVRNGDAPTARHVPAIAITAFARAEERDRILASGFGYHLAKPIDPVEMASVVRRAVRNAM
jgi:CheY-like chemotaxis protein